MLEVNVAVAHEGVYAGCGDVVVGRGVLEVREGFFVVAFLVEADCDFHLGAVAALVSVGGGFLVEDEGYGVVLGDVGAANCLVGLGAAALGDEEPDEDCGDYHEDKDGEAEDELAVGLCTGDDVLCFLCSLLGSLGLVVFHFMI